MSSHNFSYEGSLRASEKVYWRLDDVIGQKASFDFNKRFLPERIAGVAEIQGLNAQERLRLNQIRGYTYAHLFGYVEEFIIAQVLDLASGRKFGNETELRSLVRFLDEETKHQELFTRTKRAFEAGFPAKCMAVEGAVDVAKFVLSKPALSVMLLTSMLEWMTQAHYTDTFQESRDELDPTFVSIFKHHWLEEAQHAKLDTLEIEQLAANASQTDRDKAVDDVLEIGGAFDGLLASQQKLDLQCLEAASGKTFDEATRADIAKHQQHAYRYTFLVSGLVHNRFIDTVRNLSPAGVDKIAGAAKALSA